MIMKEHIKEGQEAPFNQAWWDSGLGPLTDAYLEKLGLTKVNLPVGPYDPLGKYKDPEGIIWVILRDYDKNIYRFYEEKE